MKENILISTGGSGGHVVPAQTLYEHLKDEFNVFLTSDLRGSKFFENNNKESFVNAILKTIDLPEYDILDEDVRSISERTKVLLEFFARPEGLEPPTL